MSTNDSFVVVRELYPETKGSFFKSKKCPKVDDVLEFAYGMDSTGGAHRLDDEKSRDAAAKRGDRIFAVSKRHVGFSTVFVNICREDGYEWNYAMEGTIKIADPSKFLSAWARDEGACGLNGIDSGSFAHRVLTSFEPTVRDEIMECRRAHGYRIRDIEEKDALPSAFWSQAFANSGAPQAGGLAIEVSDKVFLSPDREIEAKESAEKNERAAIESRTAGLRASADEYAKKEWDAAEALLFSGKKERAEMNYSRASDLFIKAEAGFSRVTKEAAKQRPQIVSAGNEGSGKFTGGANAAARPTGGNATGNNRPYRLSDAIIGCRNCGYRLTESDRNSWICPNCAQNLL